MDSGSEFFKNKTYLRITEGYERFHPDSGVIRLGPCTPNKHDCQTKKLDLKWEPDAFSVRKPDNDANFACKLDLLTQGLSSRLICPHFILKCALR